MLNRIKQYIDYKNISIHKFEQSVGMSNGAFANALKKGTTIYADRIANILKTYTDLSPKWVLTGEGHMLTEDFEQDKVNISATEGVPFYEVDFLGGFAEMYNDQHTEPDGYISEDVVKGADCWCKLTGHSMEPTIQDGDLIALKAYKDWSNNMISGQIYAIITTNGLRTVKRIGKAKNESILKLEPDNNEYKPLEIEKNNVTHVFKVVGLVHKFA